MKSNPRFPLGDNLLVNLDLLFLDGAWNDIRRIIETTPLDALEGFQIPLGGACVTYESFVPDMKPGRTAWFAHAHRRD